ncbi:outer membrane protein assembly factor BamE [Thioclava sp. BHET1]|nr:outer membrane protein assembly factor BamE [Thioclava sp. BHET1]
MALGLFVAVSACSPVYVDHGYAPTEGELKQVHIGDTRDAVQQAIGAPSVEGVEAGDDWYYVQSRWRHFGPFKPREAKREVVAVEFNKAGRVANIERFGLAKGHVVALSRRVTTSTVKTPGLLNQLASDFGRFNPANFLRNNNTNTQ